MMYGMKYKVYTTLLESNLLQNGLALYFMDYYSIVIIILRVNIGM